MARRPPPLSPSVVLLFLLLILLPACLLVARGEPNRGAPRLTPIDLDLYHSSARLMEEIKALVHRHPDKLTMNNFRSGNRGYRAELAVVTYCRNVREINDKSKFRILLSFGQHGRELITSEVALRILSILTEEQFLPNVDSVSLNSFLDKLIIKVVPMENVNGRRLVEAGDLCERRNGRGVDLNRNWSVDWGKKEKDYDPYEENPGTGPFSEPESQIMRKLATSFNPHIWVNVHSGMEVSVIHFLLMLLYLAHGTATDYMYDIARVPMAFTFEIYGDGAASPKDCFKMFNPTDISTYNRVLSDWSAAFFTIFKHGPRYLDEIHLKDSRPSSWESMDEYLEGYLMDRSSRYGKKMEVLDFGMQEIRTYFRLFLLSFVLLMFMFCSRISKSKLSRPGVPSVPV
ncbi:hypothetical protein EUGRSUZ_E03516 [Eucalyptus grandis]|uniref:Uncharacterized protein n=1 Tax=Eucalyptus grandis TaxID=71139 RepID=A0ACC3LD30_EUCGR|nr:hypothetical protein EUGRSUZ_E03516 [Eucalyptus grandis]